MKHILTKYKPHIDKRLKLILQQNLPRLKTMHSLTGAVESYLADFTISGKSIRGSLLLYTYASYGGKKIEDVLPVACAVELFQSGFLIHDDIIDDDKMRRGKPSAWMQFSSPKVSKDNAYGKNHAVCIGDICFFLGYKTLISARVAPDLLQQIVALMSSEYLNVGLAETQDVRMAAATSVLKEEILELYRYKTARYTFSLPFVLGAMLAGASEEERDVLSDLGESLGIMFQIVDDGLSLFGKQKMTGKPIFGDIQEGKKTLHLQLLYEKASGDDTHKLQKIIGGQMTKDDVRFVQSLLTAHNIDQDMRGVTEYYRMKASKLVERLDLSKKSQAQLLQFIDHLSSRDR